MSRIWTKDEITNYVNKSDKGLMNGLILLYNKQTEDEKVVEHVRFRNGMGFNRPDAKILTSIAKQWIDQKWVSPKQIYTVRKRIVKYVGQLTEIANYELNK